MKLEKAVKKCIQEKQASHPQAAESYKVWLRRFCEHMGDIDIEDIEMESVLVWFRALNDKYKDSTVQIVKVSLRWLFKWCDYEGINALSYQRIKAPNAATESHIAVKPEEFWELRSLCETNDYYNIVNRLILDLLWDTGMRVSELSDLSIKQIDFDEQKAFIRTKKTKDRRQVFWSNRTQETIDKYLPIRRELGRNDRLLLGYNQQTGVVYNQISKRSIERRIRKLLKESGIMKTITPHSFRHGRAHQWRKHGADIQFIADMLGHKNIQSSRVYQQVENSMIEGEARRYFQLETA